MALFLVLFCDIDMELLLLLLLGEVLPLLVAELGLRGRLFFVVCRSGCRCCSCSSCLAARIASLWRWRRVGEDDAFWMSGAA